MMKYLFKKRECSTITPFCIQVAPVDYIISIFFIFYLNNL